MHDLAPRLDVPAHVPAMEGVLLDVPRLVDRPSRCLATAPFADVPGPAIPGGLPERLPPPQRLECVPGDDALVLGPNSRIPIALWPGGTIPFRVLDPAGAGDPFRDVVARALAVWQRATNEGVQFVACDDACPPPVLEIRSDANRDAGGSSSTGAPAADDDGWMSLGPNVEDATVVHEIGHALGLVHPWSRRDRDRFLRVWLSDLDHSLTTFEAPEIEETDDPPRSPLLDDYDYRSVMHYGIRVWVDLPGAAATEKRWIRDLNGHRVTRGIVDTTGVTVPSPSDVSRVLQYYFCAANPHWGFFRSLALLPMAPEAPRISFLDAAAMAPAVEAEGTPAIVTSGPDFEVFVVGRDRGTNQRRLWHHRAAPEVVWTPIDGLAIASDPAVVRVSGERTAVAYVDAASGRVFAAERREAAWSRPALVGDGPLRAGRRGPGLRVDASRPAWFVAPAVAARHGGDVAVAVLGSDGRIHVTHQSSRWKVWATYEARGVTRIALTEGLDRNLVVGCVIGNEVHVLTIERRASRWRNLGGAVMPDTPVSMAVHEGRLHVVATTVNGRLAVFRGGLGWAEIGGRPRGGTTAAVGSDGRRATLAMVGEPWLDATGAELGPGAVWVRDVREDPCGALDATRKARQLGLG